jgi:hypothetical protein
MNDSLALGGGPYHFFVRSSFKAAASSIDSASSFFSWTLLLTSPILDFSDSLWGDESGIGRWAGSLDFSTSMSG